MTTREFVHVVTAGTFVRGAEHAAELGLPRPGTRQYDLGTGRYVRTVIVCPGREHMAPIDGPIRLHHAYGTEQLAPRLLDRLAVLAGDTRAQEGNP